MKQDLYFMVNPALGIVKIGVAANTYERRKTLECQCGVPLDVLAIADGAADLERALHDTFGPSRLMGEWFTPTDEMLQLVRDVATAGLRARPLIKDFLDATAARTEAWRRECNAAAQREEQEAIEQERAERERLAALKREAEQLKAERAEKRDRRRLEKEKRQREQIAAEQREWAAKSAQFAEPLIRKELRNAAEERRAVIATSQRARNAAMIGIDVKEIAL